MRAVDVMREAVVCDMTLPWCEPYMEDADITLPRYKQAGVNFVSLTVGIRHKPLDETIRHISRVKAHIRARSDQMVLATEVDDIFAAKASGRLAVGLHFQGTDALEGRLELVQTFHDLGVRHMLLAYNLKNAVGDGCAERTDGGLSRYGLRLIEEMNRVGVIVDGSHTGYRTTMEAMEICKAPFIFSHSNAFTLVPNYRNIKDDQIRACAKSGGLVGVNGVNEFLGEPKAPTEAMFQQVDYLCGLVGPDHVGIGLDYVKDVEALWQWVQSDLDLFPANDGVPVPYPVHAQPEQIGELVSLMLGHGYGERDARAILGGNFLRVLSAVRAASAHGTAGREQRTQAHEAPRQ